MVTRFAEDFSLRLLDIHTDEIEGSSSNASMDFFDIGVAEILIMPTSSMINRKIADAGFRNKFSVNVLGVRRKNDYKSQAKAWNIPLSTLSSFCAFGF